MSRARPSVRAQFTSNWIELLVIPVASAIMEALPITLGLQVLLQKFFLALADLQGINVASVTLVLLGLHWWMMWSCARSKVASVAATKIRVLLPQMLSFLLAVAFLLWANPAFSEDLGGWTVMLLLAGVVWWRSYSRTRPDEETEQLVGALKFGFLVMLVVLVTALAEQSQGSANLKDTLTTALPIFFLSGLLALSFKRLSLLKQEQGRQSQGSRGLGTGRWLVILAIAWVAVIIGSIVFAALPPAVLASVINVFLVILVWLVSWLAYLFSLLHFPGASQNPSLPELLKGKPQMPRTSVQHLPNPAGLSLPISLLEFGAGILLVVVLLVVLLRRRVHEVNESGEDEVRENLDKEMIRRERRRERDQRPKLEELEPSSARARYREFLTAMDAQGLSRHADETPAEYQARLLTLTQTSSEAEGQQTPPDQEILANLTQAYTHERYGTKSLTPERQAYLRQWIPQLLQRLAKKT